MAAMRVVFIHSSTAFFKSLGSHYEQLIKHTMNLVPRNQYVALSSTDKQKYRVIESLPTGYIIGVALVDNSFWLKSDDLNNPWAHGPYCYHIRDALRLSQPIKCRGRVALWRIGKADMHRIRSMPCVTKRIQEWTHKFDIEPTDTMHFRALSIAQPFAEAIVRKIKSIENRKSAHLFRVHSRDEDGQFHGCRVCIAPHQTHKRVPFNYAAYGQQFQLQSLHANHELQRTAAMDKIRYQRSATLTQCVCDSSAYDDEKSNFPLGDSNDDNHVKRKNDKQLKHCLLEMGFAEEQIEDAMHRKPDLPTMIEYLLALRTVRNSKRLGYSDVLRYDSKGRRGKRRLSDTCWFDHDENDESKQKWENKNKKRK